MPSPSPDLSLSAILRAVAVRVVRGAGVDPRPRLVRDVQVADAAQAHRLVEGDRDDGRRRLQPRSVDGVGRHHRRVRRGRPAPDEQHAEEEAEQNAQRGNASAHSDIPSGCQTTPDARASRVTKCSATNDIVGIVPAAITNTIFSNGQRSLMPSCSAVMTYTRNR